MTLFNSQPKEISSYLDQLIDDKGWEEKLVEVKIPETWSEVVGETVARNAKVSKFEDGVLTVLTESSTWRSELKLRADDIVKKLNKKLNKDIIKRLKIK